MTITPLSSYMGVTGTGSGENLTSGFTDRNKKNLPEMLTFPYSIEIYKMAVVRLQAIHIKTLYDPGKANQSGHTETYLCTAGINRGSYCKCAIMFFLKAIWHHRAQFVIMQGSATQDMLLSIC